MARTAKSSSVASSRLTITKKTHVVRLRTRNELQIPSYFVTRFGSCTDSVFPLAEPRAVSKDPSSSTTAGWRNVATNSSSAQVRYF